MKGYFKAVPFLLIALVMLGLVGCGERSAAVTNESQRDAIHKAAQRSVYQPKNDLEFKNYNKRQQLADDPTTILWCTAFPNNPSAPMLTYPVAGKLSSGNKRPYATTQAIAGAQSTRQYNPELPGADGMYGTSGDYRYGFTPAGVYVDFYEVPTVCSTEPSVVQRQSTKLVLQSDPELLEAQNRAKAALAENKPDQAQKILEEAILKVQGGR